MKDADHIGLIYVAHRTVVPIATRIEEGLCGLCRLILHVCPVSITRCFDGKTSVDIDTVSVKCLQKIQPDIQNHNRQSAQDKRKYEDMNGGWSV